MAREKFPPTTRAGANATILTFMVPSEKIPHGFKYTCACCSFNFPAGRKDTIAKHLLENCKGLSFDEYHWIVRECYAQYWIGKGPPKSVLFERSDVNHEKVFEGGHPADAVRPGDLRGMSSLGSGEHDTASMDTIDPNIFSSQEEYKERFEQDVRRAGAERTGRGNRERGRSRSPEAQSLFVATTPLADGRLDSGWSYRVRDIEGRDESPGWDGHNEDGRHRGGWSSSNGIPLQPDGGPVSGPGFRVGSTTRQPRKTKAQHTKWEQEKLDRQNMVVTPSMSGDSAEMNQSARRPLQQDEDLFCSQTPDGKVDPGTHQNTAPAVRRPRSARPQPRLSAPSVPAQPISRRLAHTLLPSTDPLIPLPLHRRYAELRGPGVPQSYDAFENNPANAMHKTWTKVFIHTAKCDQCHQHNTNILQRCSSCNLQYCKGCVDAANADGLHVMNADELDWTR